MIIKYYLLQNAKPVKEIEEEKRRNKKLETNNINNVNKNYFYMELT